MALLNGVLVHGPNAWACAIRTRDGELKVAAEYKRVRANRVRSPLLRGPARLTAQLGAVAASTEIFSWMVRNPERKLARVLARPGHELQHRLATAEPSPEQLAVAEAALAACLELEQKAIRQAET